MITFKVWLLCVLLQQGGLHHCCPASPRQPLWVWHPGTQEHCSTHHWLLTPSLPCWSTYSYDILKCVADLYYLLDFKISKIKDDKLDFWYIYKSLPHISRQAGNITSRWGHQWWPCCCSPVSFVTELLGHTWWQIAVVEGVLTCCWGN